MRAAWRPSDWPSSTRPTAVCLIQHGGHQGNVTEFSACMHEHRIVVFLLYLPAMASG